MMNFLMMLSIILSTTFMFMKHPLSMGFILLMQTITISLITGLLNKNFWFSYILFLIMIGGMLILFIYMTSVVSNKKFKFSFNLTLLLMTMLLFTLLIMFLDQYMFNFLTMNNYTLEFNSMNSMHNLSKFMNYPNYFILFILYIYLFITLIAVTKISNINMGPLRQKF